MINPLITIIIPTHNRPELLSDAVASALNQTIENFEVIVVDDASEPPVKLPKDPRLKVIRLSRSRGGAGARNLGTEAAQGRWITYLDDDDLLLPQMAAISLEALETTNLPQPVAVISGIEVLDANREVTEIRLPPSFRQRGCHFTLEELELGRSYNTKQTLVVERNVIQKIGSWDETFRSRVHTELFLRLNPVCSIIGLPTVTYQLRSHEGARVSQNPKLRQESFHRLLDKHREVFAAHPERFANFVCEQALMSYWGGQRRMAFLNLCRAMTIHPIGTVARLQNHFQSKYAGR